MVRAVPAAKHVKEYIGRLVLGTHPSSSAPEITRKYIRYGASPRGAQAILLGGKGLALREGRYNVSFADVRAVLGACLRHRVILNFEGQAEGIGMDAILKKIVDATAETVG